MFKALVVFAASACVAHAALAIATLQPKPEKYKDQEGCYIGELDYVIPYGQAAPSKAVCMQYRCEPKFVQHETCGVEIPISSCKLVAKPEKPYPECCSKVEC